MANPKRKTSKSKRDKRKAQWLGALSARSLSECPNCNEQRLPHHACPHCGYYKGQKVTAGEE
ncbi:MAG: 50S ribosomal protein L32 [Calditrichia bacterium]